VCAKFKGNMKYLKKMTIQEEGSIGGHLDHLQSPKKDGDARVPENGLNNRALKFGEKSISSCLSESLHIKHPRNSLSSY
jgi:hypothetical protein